MSLSWMNDNTACLDCIIDDYDTFLMKIFVWKLLLIFVANIES